MPKAIITTNDMDDMNAFIAVLIEAEENGEIDFAYSMRTTDFKVSVRTTDDTVQWEIE